MLNASLGKNFAITERYKLNYRIEAFNVLNHTVLNAPGGTVGPDMSRFGIITSAWIHASSRCRRASSFDPFHGEDSSLLRTSPHFRWWSWQRAAVAGSASS